MKPIVMRLFERWLAPRGPAPAQAAYDAVVARARAPHWYLDGGVADSVDGRFDMIVAVLAMLMLRMEREAAGAAPAAALAERLIDDMDGQLRQIGIGDVVVGKHIGKMMGMLGGRLGAYRDALATAEPDALDGPLVRNLYRGASPDPAAVAHVRDGLIAFRAKLADRSVETLMTGDLP